MLFWRPWGARRSIPVERPGRKTRSRIYVKPKPLRFLAARCAGSGDLGPLA